METSEIFCFISTITCIKKRTLIRYLRNFFNSATFPPFKWAIFNFSLPGVSLTFCVDCTLRCMCVKLLKSICCWPLHCQFYHIPAFLFFRVVSMNVTLELTYPIAYDWQPFALYLIPLPLLFPIYLGYQ